jgi:hypothetical protein
MKNILKFIVVLVGVGLLLSCEKQVKEPVLDVTQTISPKMLAPDNGSAFVLLEENESDLVTTFQWEPASYNLTNLQATTYNLQMALADSSFSTFKIISSTTETSYSPTVEEINGLLLSLGAVIGEARDVEIRLYSYVTNSTDVTDTYSDILTLNFTPYSSEISYPMLWVPGEYQGWAPDVAPNLFDFDGDGIYTGYIYFPEDAATFEFKFTSAPNWDDVNYGAGAEPGILDTDGGAGNLSVPGPGGYHFSVDPANLTWSGYDLVENWGVIGEWLAWETDINMEYDFENQQLFVTVENIPAADNQRFKFRANDAWDINLGANDPDDGFLTQGGADIPIPDGGTITFYLRFTTPEPSYEWE